MTDVKTVATILEREIVENSGTIGPDTWQAWMDLPREARIVFAVAAKFLGCKWESSESALRAPIAQADRIVVVRLLLLKLGVHQCEPRWSSSVLDRIVAIVMAFPGGSVGDLYCALYGLLGDYPCDLSPTMANFIQDFVVKCFTQYRDSYESVNWGSLAEAVNRDSKTTQLYLALLAIPPEDLPSEVASLIEKGLESTPYSHAVHNFPTA
jgi:hypothetical protein